MANINPLFTIITVSYHSENTIADTIKSVLEQDFVDCEFIIIDGTSKDNTIPVARSFIEAFNSKGIAFTIISEKDKGIYDAMNKGIMLAKGNWIGIINSDDFYESGTLKKVAEAIQLQPTTEIFYGNMNLYDSENKEITTIKPMSDLSKMGHTMNIFHPTVFIKKHVYHSWGVYDLRYRLTADWDLLKRMYVNGVKFQYVDATFANFRKGGAGSGFKKTHLVERFHIRHKSFKISYLWYDIKDLFIYAHYLIFPNKSLF